MWFNRGFEAIMLALNDSRFKKYDKYFIGFNGIGVMKHNPGDWFTEYNALTDLIEKGEIKYLPEHIDSLRDTYVNQFKKSLWNLFDSK